MPLLNPIAIPSSLDTKVKLHHMLAIRSAILTQPDDPYPA